MRELDRAAEAARTPKAGTAIPAEVAVLPLRSARYVAGRLFSRIDALGLQDATVHLTEHAIRHGVAAALPV